MGATTGGVLGGNRDGLDFGAGPGRPGQVLRLHPETGQRHLDLLTWGLLRHDTKDPATALRPIHARAETVAELPMFASAFRSRRAIVPADEFYQRRTLSGLDQRYAISRKDGRPMAIAGLWESYVSPAREITRTYCIIAVEANATLAPIHGRMPLVLEEKDWPIWLGEVPGDPTALLHPSADDVLMARLIRTKRTALP